AVLRQGDLAMLSNLHRRVGDEATVGNGGSPDVRNTTRAWGRVVGGRTTLTQGGTTAPESRTSIGGFQTGVDLFADDRWNAGLYFGKLRSDASVRGVYSLNAYRAYAGSLRVDTHYLGGYATYVDSAGMYIDTMLQYGFQDLNATAVNGRRINSDGKSLTASVELGKSFQLNSDWSLEPQAQLIFNRQNLDDAQIAGLTTVHRDTTSSAVGRLGIRATGDFGTRAGRLRPYARLNLWHGFKGTDRTTFAGGGGSTTFDSAMGYTSVEVAAGATLALTTTTSVYGEVGNLRHLGGGGQKVKSSVQGTVGVKLRF
ncbi:MAG: autotransporter domain-containing protein, partial [Comamonadaceae bacterium]